MNSTWELVVFAESLMASLRQIRPNLHAASTARILAKCVFWAVLLAIVLLSIVPPSGRPVTRVPHVFEHVAIFLLLGLSFAAGYRFRWASILGLVVYTAGVEILQFVAPGRHPRWLDLVENVVGLGLGTGLIYLLNFLLDRIRFLSDRSTKRPVPTE
jgi:VanZ family protein